MDKTVVKAFRVLELLVQAGEPMSITRLAAQTGLQKSNVHRLLATLGALGYVRHGETSLYEPSLRVWEMGQQVYGRLGLASAARPHLRRLMEQTGESAHLAIFDGTEIVYLDKVETANPVRAYTVVGGRAPAYCTASGKALLAWQSAETVRAVANGIRRLTPETIADHAALARELALVRGQGYAINSGEFRPNVAGLAAPVQAGSEVIAAVGISGPLDRLRPRKIKSLAPTVVAAAEAVARTMAAPRRG
ncbi:MAG TPA: IclR family transcriptional regulator [Burkholderiales bacterium]|nr:IclR family transcriptional regulator [Burkholderiales bacterium]